MPEFSAEDRRYMARALELARRGLYTTDPNPRVGCVLVRDGEVVGEGWHERAGEPHAEVHALREAGDRAAGATAYVTLEPCSHHGRTPPCADALIAAGVARVVSAMEDPNPAVAGSGLANLAAAGIETASGLMAEEAERINRGFVSRMRRGMPWVTVKLAMSLDGRTAMASGESRWITGPDARADVHRMRARSSVLLTGAGTVLADDPSLDARIEGTAINQPLRAVFDPHLSTPPTARLFGAGGPVLVFTASNDAAPRAELERAGAEVLLMPDGPDRIDLAGALRELARRECNEVMVEAGATLAGALVEAGMVDELVIYMAPRLMGHGARALLQLPAIERMSQALELDIIDLRAVGRDWRVTASVVKE